VLCRLSHDRVLVDHGVSSSVRYHSNGDERSSSLLTGVDHGRPGVSVRC